MTITECRGWAESDLEHASHMDAERLSGRLACDFCQTPTDRVYKHVYLCPRCGLVQSEPRSDRTISTSCEADQGNLRNGKAFRFPQSVPLLERLDWSQITTALDIGSNRGTFVRWMGKNHPYVRVDAVEPEVRLIDYAREVRVHGCRFEDVASDLGPVDLVFSSHTLEHSQSADAMMRATERLMPIGSHMLLEVPNLAAITDPRVVEEFFIYKHNWHLSVPLLIPYLIDLGFEVVAEETTTWDIRLLLRKVSEAIPFRAFSFPVQMTRDWLADYQYNLERNRAALPRVVEQINALKAHKLAVWGAGRIFDALVRFGGLDPRSITTLADGMLCGVVDTVHGIELCHPNDLALHQPDVIVVLGRTSSDAMVTKAEQYSPMVLTFNALLDEALS